MRVRDWFEKQLLNVKSRVYIIYFDIVKKNFLKNYRSDIDFDLLIPDSRHLVQDNADKIKRISIRILKCIDFLSEKYDFKLFLAYGTLLGAVRHGGFIPWDDDVDIMMTRRDFNIFISVAKHLPPSIEIRPMAYNFIKVMDKYSKISMDGKRGVAVDIFIVEGKSENYYFWNVHKMRNFHLKSRELFPLISVKFEDLTLNVPKEYVKILVELYGDYMKLPPIEDQKSHHTNESMINIHRYK